MSASCESNVSAAHADALLNITPQDLVRNLLRSKFCRNGAAHDPPFSHRHVKVSLPPPQCSLSNVRFPNIGSICDYCSFYSTLLLFPHLLPFLSSSVSSGSDVHSSSRSGRSLYGDDPSDKHYFFIGYYGKQKLERGEQLEDCVLPEFSVTQNETEGKGTRHYVGSCQFVCCSESKCVGPVGNDDVHVEGPPWDGEGTYVLEDKTAYQPFIDLEEYKHLDCYGVTTDIASGAYLPVVAT